MAYDRRRKPKRQNLDADDLEFEEKIGPENHRRLCEVTGKVCWRTQSIAAGVAKQMRRKDQNSFIDEYLCKHCSEWHIGHRPGTLSQIDELIKFHKKSNTTVRKQ